MLDFLLIPQITYRSTVAFFWNNSKPVFISRLGLYSDQIGNSTFFRHIVYKSIFYMDFIFLRNAQLRTYIRTPRQTETKQRNYDSNNYSHYSF